MVLYHFNLALPQVIYTTVGFIVSKQSSVYFQSLLYTSNLLVCYDYYELKKLYWINIVVDSIILSVSVILNTCLPQTQYVIRRFMINFRFEVDLKFYCLKVHFVLELLKLELPKKELTSTLWSLHSFFFISCFNAHVPYHTSTVKQVTIFSIPGWENQKN